MADNKAALEFLAQVKESIKVWFRGNAVFLMALKKGEDSSILKPDDPLFVQSCYQAGILLKPIMDEVGPAAAAMIISWVLAELKEIFKQPKT